MQVGIQLYLSSCSDWPAVSSKRYSVRTWSYSDRVSVIFIRPPFIISAAKDRAFLIYSGPWISAHSIICIHFSPHYQLIQLSYSIISRHSESFQHNNKTIYCSPMQCQVTLSRSFWHSSCLWILVCSSICHTLERVFPGCDFPAISCLELRWCCTGIAACFSFSLWNRWAVVWSPRLHGQTGEITPGTLRRNKNLRSPIFSVRAWQSTEPSAFASFSYRRRWPPSNALASKALSTLAGAVWAWATHRASQSLAAAAPESQQSSGRPVLFVQLLAHSQWAPSSRLHRSRRGRRLLKRAST